MKKSRGKYGQGRVYQPRYRDASGHVRTVERSCRFACGVLTTVVLLATRKPAPIRRKH